MDRQEVHYFHHSDPAPARTSIKIERTSRSTNFEVAVSDAGSDKEAFERATALYKRLSEAFPQAEAM